MFTKHILSSCGWAGERQQVHRSTAPGFGRQSSNPFALQPLCSRPGLVIFPTPAVHLHSSPMNSCLPLATLKVPAVLMSKWAELNSPSQQSGRQGKPSPCVIKHFPLAQGRQPCIDLGDCMSQTLGGTKTS